MSQEYSIKLTLGYEGTDFERLVTVSGVDSIDAATETVRAKAQAVNESLAGGTDGGLADFFRADDFDAQEQIGNLSAIKQVVIDNTTKKVLI